MGFKVNAQERAEIEKKARQHAGGNISAYLRYAAMNFDPSVIVKIRGEK